VTGPEPLLWGSQSWLQPPFRRLLELCAEHVW
jgi:hypothetical protein